jgi:TrmH family RNA methyltransferase
MRTISSRQNPVVRLFRDLATDTDRAGTRLLLDGAHLVHDAHRAGARFEIVAVAASRSSTDHEEGRLAAALDALGADVVMAPDSVFAAMSPVRSPSGIAAVIERPSTEPDAIARAANALILMTVDIQDPGNLGSTTRAAEAFGATGVLVCSSSGNPPANPFSWKALRGSMGSALRIPIAAGLDAATTIDDLRRSGVRTVATIARGGRDPQALSWADPVAVVLGGEGAGLSPSLAGQCDERVTIPMAPAVESLNVAVAGAILLYAGRRAR